jgi:hypothetical protein
VIACDGGVGVAVELVPVAACVLDDAVPWAPDLTAVEVEDPPAFDVWDWPVVLFEVEFDAPVPDAREPVPDAREPEPEPEPGTSGWPVLCDPDLPRESVVGGPRPRDLLAWPVGGPARYVPAPWELPDAPG